MTRDGGSVPDIVDDEGNPGWIFESIDEVRAFLDAEEGRRKKVSGD